MTDLALIGALAIAFIAGFICGGLLVAWLADRIDTPDEWEGR